jgi:cyanate permease
MGIGFAHYVTYLNMQTIFNHKRGLVTGIFAASKAVSRASMPLLSEALAKSLGYQNMMRVLAVVISTSIVFGIIQTMKEPTCFARNKQDKINQDEVESPEQRESASVGDTMEDEIPVADKKCGARARRLCSSIRSNIDFSVMTEPIFIALTVVDCLLGLTDDIFLVLPLYSAERQFSVRAAATMLSIIAITEFSGRFIIPPLLDIQCVKYQYVFSSLLFTSATLCISELSRV